MGKRCEFLDQIGILSVICVLEADWVFVANSVGLPQPKVGFVNIFVIIGSVLGKGVNCQTNLVFCQYNVLL